LRSTASAIGHVSPIGLRVALFADSFRETNGVGTLCRAYTDYARQRQLPFFCAYGGAETKSRVEGSVEELELRRGPMSFPIDTEMTCDPFLARHRGMAVGRLRRFRPDIVHITGPGDVGILGFWASNAVGVPMVASWHTNLHDYADRRLQNNLPFLPCLLRRMAGAGASHGALWALKQFYRIAHFVATPNQEMTDLLARITGRPAFRMAHGVNTELFRPDRRRRTDTRFCIGYVGRLTPEKNVRALVDLERRLRLAGEVDFRILLVGEGSETCWMKANLPTAEFTGTLRGEPLATAFANMDAFVFPSLTDTFGLVILEAMSSGVPVVLPPATGQKAGVRDGVDGILTDDACGAVRRLMHCPATAQRMGIAGRENACARAWSGVFDDLQRIYSDGLGTADVQRRMPQRRMDLPEA
jgi:glycosyltransferase involved in cell wall biosynthesis